MVDGTVWIANEGGGSLTAIDAATNEVMTTVSGVEGPHNVQVSPGGGSISTVSGHDNYAAMVTADSLDLHGAVRAGAAPAHVDVSPDGATAYITNGEDDTVTVIDTATMKPVDTIQVGRSPHGLAPARTAAGSSWRTSPTSRSASSAAGPTAWSPRSKSEWRPPRSPSPRRTVRLRLALRRGRRRQGRHDNAQARRRSCGRRRPRPDLRQLRQPLPPRRQSGHRRGTRHHSPSHRTRDIYRDRHRRDGAGAHGIVVDPSSRHAYVTNIYGDDVAVLDLEELKVVARIAVRDKPNGVSFSTFATVEGPDSVTLELPGTAGTSQEDMEDEHDDEGHDGGH